LLLLELGIKRFNYLEERYGGLARDEIWWDEIKRHANNV